MRVELLQRWQGYRSGLVINPPDGVANTLIRRQIARPAGDGLETAMAPAAAERAVKFNRQKGR
jgi:hypothetical protein